jgi:hypothetical protein
MSKDEENKLIYNILSDFIDKMLESAGPEHEKMLGNIDILRRDLKRTLICQAL